MANITPSNHRTLGATIEVGRTYEDAIHVLESRRRPQRPQAERLQDVKSSPPTHSRAESGTPGLKGLPGIVGMTEWLAILGHSEEAISRLPVIHVAGTKGKGSTCAFAESFLRAHGRRTGSPQKTGLYTSPHLLVPEERIRINSQSLPKTQFAKYFFEIYDRLPQLASPFNASQSVIERGPRALQIYALLAFHVFIREAVDIAIIETHCGGEYDATNFLKHPIAAVVTTLGMDHIDMLGPTIENIAWHKAGIYKPGAIALSAMQEVAPARALVQRAQEKDIDVRFVGIDPALPSDSLALAPQVQRQNASVALAAANAVLASERHSAPEDTACLLSPDDIRQGVEQFSWPGRFQIISEGKFTWFLDAAHNDMSIEVAAHWFIEAGEKKSTNIQGPLIPQILIFTHINELRDATSLLRTLAKTLHSPHISHVIFTSYAEMPNTDPNTQPRLLPPLPHLQVQIPQLLHEFNRVWREVDSTAQVFLEPTVQEAMGRSRDIGAANGARVLVTGSQFLVGPVLRMLERGQKG